MILTRRKPATPKTLTDGSYKAKIESIQESLDNGKDCLIFKFKCKSGQINALIPADKNLLQTLSGTAYLCSLKQGFKLADLVGHSLTIQIINGTVKNLTK